MGRTGSTFGVVGMFWNQRWLYNIVNAFSTTELYILNGLPFTSKKITTNETFPRPPDTWKLADVFSKNTGNRGPGEEHSCLRQGPGRNRQCGVPGLWSWGFPPL